MKVLSIDPSGTGTTGICLISNEQIEFQEYQDKDWQKHYHFIVSLVKAFKPSVLLFENTNFLSNRSKDSLNLIRLLGALECLGIKQVDSVNVLKVKDLSKKLLAGIFQIENLQYLPGRGKGWMFNNKRISIHCLEAYLVYWLFLNK